MLCPGLMLRASLTNYNDVARNFRPPGADVYSGHPYHKL